MKIPGNFRPPWCFYDQLIQNSNPVPLYYCNRARIHESLNEFDIAENDYLQPINLDPHNAIYNWKLGGCLLSNEFIKHGKITGNGSKKILDEIINYYRLALSKDPTNECARIDYIEILIITKEGDHAICEYGSCKNFIKSKPFQVIWSFLGNLAFALGGEEITIADLHILKDKSFSVSQDHYRFCEIESLIRELENSGFDRDKISNAKMIFRLFLTHFNEEPSSECYY
jgi:tetratricopeptide (TPR) repeat protein